ncbi:MAG TPA: phosphoribosylanthranilate isomerase [Methylomirabilota bacterium]|nr:phosphoribosylanthranilate isomerase [Methylomirabilota bacterium]
MIRVKICGITNLEDALRAAEAGADALGFIFVEGTPRFVTPAAVAPIVRALPPFVCPVGVFWDHPPAHVAAVVEECGLGAVQLHGSEPPEAVVAAPRPVLKTVKVGGPADLDQLGRYRPAAFLLDSPARWSERGEARPPVPWTLARTAAARARVVLSGGLTPETVAGAIRIARPWGVDVNSGVEVRPGRKDAERMRGFIRAARSAAAMVAEAAALDETSRRG